jgi:two-component system LytT family response regulator
MAEPAGTNIRVLIVEDEPLARQRLRSFVDELEWVTCVGEAADGRAALDLLNEHRPDLVFLDIELPELTGLEVLARSTHTPAVVFTTAYDRYAVSAFELAAVDYLLKPFGHDRFLAAIERARRSLVTSTEAGVDPEDLRLEREHLLKAGDRAHRALAEGSAPLTRLLVRDRGRITPVAIADVERLEAEDDYVALFARGRRHLVYLPLNDFEQRLDRTQFVRVHRSHIVNLDFVRHLTPFDAGRLQIEMLDGTRILASRTRSKTLRDLAL